jgi:hypothetical protein
MSSRVYMNYKVHGAPRSDQGEVWEEVDRKLHAMGSSSPSFALEQAYTDYEEKLRDLVEHVRVPEGCHGVVFAFGGRVAGADLFDRPATLQRLMPKLVRGYALDALEVSEPTPAPGRQDVEQWLRTAGGANFERFDSPGVGDDVRIGAQGLTGAGLLVDGRPVHVELFPVDDQPDRPMGRPPQAPQDVPDARPSRPGSPPEPVAPSSEPRAGFWSRIRRRPGK